MSYLSSIFCLKSARTPGPATQMPEVNPHPDPKRLNLLKCIYFLGGLSGATWGRFSTIYFNKILHLTVQQIGFIEMVMPVVRLLTTPLWGVLADRCHAKKTVYLFTTIVSSSVLLLQASPTLASGFYPVLAINALLSAFVSGGVLDAYTLSYLDQFKQTRKYGQIRLYTAVSWGLGNVVMGYVTDHYPFFYNFLLFGIFAVLRTAAIWFVIPSDVVQQREPTPSTEYTEPDDRRALLEEQLLKNVAAKWDDDEEQTGKGKEEDNDANDSTGDGEEQHREEEERPDATCHELCRVLMQPTFLFLLFEVAVIGMGIGVVERLLFVYLQRDLQASTFLCGLTVLVTVVFELPIFTYTDWLLTTLGKDIMFIVAMLAYVVRALG